MSSIKIHKKISTTKIILTILCAGIFFSCNNDDNGNSLIVSPPCDDVVQGDFEEVF